MSLISTILKHERIIILVVVGVVIIAVCIVFSLPLKTIEYETVETYYETETKTEPEVVNKPYTVEQEVERSEILLEGSHIMVPHGISTTFEVDKDNTELFVSFTSNSPGICNVLSSASHIIYELNGSQGKFTLPLEKGSYTVRFRENLLWGEEISMHVELRWPEIVEITQYREVITYREIPVQVEKEKRIWSSEKVSMRQWFFR